MVAGEVVVFGVGVKGVRLSPLANPPQRKLLFLRLRLIVRGPPPCPSSLLAADVTPEEESFPKEDASEEDVLDLDGRVGS